MCLGLEEGHSSGSEGESGGSSGGGRRGASAGGSLAATRSLALRQRHRRRTRLVAIARVRAVPTTIVRVRVILASVGAVLTIIDRVALVVGSVGHGRLGIEHSSSGVVGGIRGHGLLRAEAQLVALARTDHHLLQCRRRYPPPNSHPAAPSLCSYWHR